MTKQQAIDANCKDCIFDDQVEGTWLQQVERCDLTHCPFWEHRPKSRSKIANIAHSVAVQPP